MYLASEPLTCVWPKTKPIFAEQLAQQGHSVYEAIAISEVYALADQHPQAQIIFDANKSAC
jgi:hypothetical protein